MGRGRRTEKQNFLREEAEHDFQETSLSHPQPVQEEHVWGEIDLPAEKNLQARGWSREDLLGLFPWVPGIGCEIKVLRLRRDVVQIQGLLRDAGSGETLGRIRRTLDLRHNIAYHNALEILDPENQNRGIGMNFFLASLRQYEKRGIQSIELYANSQIGGYFWARAGFQLSSPEAGLQVRRKLEDHKQKLEEAAYLLRSLQEDFPELSLEQAQRDLATNLDFLQEILGEKHMRIDRVAAFRPLVRMPSAALELIEDPEAASLLRQLRGKNDDPLSGKTLLRQSGWSGTFELNNPLCQEILQSYLRSRGL